MKDKRGQGLPLTTIVVAIIVLVVLVVLVAVFTGRIAIFEREIGDKTDLASGIANEGETCQVEEFSSPGVCRDATACNEDSSRNWANTTTESEQCRPGLVCCKT